MVNEGDFVAIFNSVHRVMKAEKLLKSGGLRILLIPAPRSLHADCGLAIRYAEADRRAVETKLQAERLMPDEIYVKREDRYAAVPLSLETNE